MERDIKSHFARLLRFGIASGSARNNAIIFGLRSLFISGILLFGFLALPLSTWHPVEQSLAYLVYRALLILGYPVVLSNTTVSSPAFSISVIQECLAIELSLLVIGFVLSFPATFKQKAFALATGLPIVASANFLRILLLFAFGSTWQRHFPFAHTFLGQTLMVAVLCILCLMWIASLHGNRELTQRVVFGLKLCAFATLFFILWVLVQRHYVAGMEILLGQIAQVVTGKPSRFQSHQTYDYTFNFVTFAALMFADWKLPFRKSVRYTIIGIAILAFSQLIFRFVCIFSATSKTLWIYQTSVGIYAISSLLLPVILWLLLRTWHLGGKAHVCPFCGVSKVGIIDHIKNVHGEEYLSKKETMRIKNRIENTIRGGFAD